MTWEYVKHEIYSASVVRCPAQKEGQVNATEYGRPPDYLTKNQDCLPDWLLLGKHLIIPGYLGGECAAQRKPNRQACPNRTG
ncbi:hypothetical protein ACJ73_10281 [Blastomyces percursus]|uniref:Uncharacterized protein n=1 Tax=Blastomyces percursus TaxID=1658174 RepID=A0A1J9NXX8_9EURO|nr:hypothetical protein ACJ73_10281 [Blastomyces percursus]